jgi:uncharacterized BrkB/YihY/UPF0761 family membrane protein
MSTTIDVDGGVKIIRRLPDEIDAQSRYASGGWVKGSGLVFAGFLLLSVLRPSVRGRRRSWLFWGWFISAFVDVLWRWTMHYGIQPVVVSRTDVAFAMGRER